MLKKNWKKILIISFLVVLCLGTAVYATYAIVATDVSYTKANGEQISVKAALDELRTKSKVQPTYKTGDIVTYSNEQFYVLYDNGGDTVTLFAKTNLNQEATAQANAAQSTTQCKFSSSQYWSEVCTNLNNVNGYAATDVMGRVNTYAKTINAISGRILTYEEANTLKTSFSDMIYGRGNTAQTNSSGQGYEDYWLGSSLSYLASSVCFVSGEDSGLYGTSFSSSNSAGVRPVIEVYKSQVSYVTYTKGQIVRCGNEDFYVLNDNGGATVELFAKTNLNQAATAQANAAYSTTNCAFSSSQYWSGAGINLNGVTGYTSTDVMGRVDTYVQTKGAISGRLLTYEEANTLKTSFSDMIYGRGNTAQTDSNGQGYENYWLGSVSSYDSSGIANVYKGTLWASGTYTVSNDKGVRPVIEVYKSQVSYVTYTKGQIVKCGNEDFYVLNDNGGATVELFAKTDLNSAATAQANAAYSTTSCAFSSSKYWSGAGINLNGVTGYTSTDVMGRVDTYVSTKGAISGRLLTYEEANTLKDTYSDMIYGRGNTAQTNSSGQGYEYYWLGSSYSDSARYVWYVDGLNSALDYYRFNRSGYGVRPVIEVYKSQVT